MTPDLASALDSFGLGPAAAAPERVAQAYSNEVWRVRTASGAYAVKLFAADLSDARRAELAAGADFERYVVERGLVPVPAPVAAAGTWLVAVGPTSRLARCHRWVAGRPATDGLPIEAIGAAGRYLGSLHALDRPGGDTAQLAPLDLDRWHRAVRSSARCQLGWAPELAELTPLVERLAADLDELRAQRRPMILSHRDYDPKNALLSDDGELVITDWDYAGPVLADVELWSSATSFGRSDDEIGAFVEAYRVARGTAAAPEPLAVTAELADLDWLLRNVEACLTVPTKSAEYETARELITALPDEVDDARDWTLPAR